MPISATPNVAAEPHEVPVSTEEMAQITEAEIRNVLGRRIDRPTLIR